MMTRTQQADPKAHPLVTVITPAYNRASYLVETIESVLNQTYPNIEYIVLDDGSEDNTQEVLAGYEGRLIWESHPNMGEARTVNKGFRMAKGDYITVVNSDDPILPNMIDEEVAYLETHPDVLMVYSDWQVIDSESHVIGYREAESPSFRDMVRKSACVPGPGAMLRRKALDLEPERVTQYRYVTDFEYWLRLGVHGPFARIPKALATHRHHDESAGVSQYKALSAELIQLMTEYFERPKLPPEIRKLRSEGISAAYYDAGTRCFEHDYGLARHYLLCSLRYAPRSVIRERRLRGFVIAAIVLPYPIYTRLRQGWRSIRQRLAG